MNKKTSDQDLVAAALRNNREAVSMLVERHKRYAFTLCYRILQHREEAEEAAHDAFMKALKSLDSYRNEAKFTTWLYRIVVNTALSHKRKVKVQHEDITQVTHQSCLSESDEPSIVAEQRTKYINLAMAMLDEIEASIVSLFYFKEFSIEEISSIVDLDKNNIKIKLFRARKKMGKSLEILLKHETNTLL